MFGASNVKSEGELRKVNIPLGNPGVTDAWAMGEEDALHIPIIASQLHDSSADESYSPDLLNPFGVYMPKKESKNIPVIKTRLANNESIEKATIGVYAPTSIAAKTLCSELAQLTDTTIQAFDASMDEHDIESASCNFTAWIIDLSDEDESPLLDQALEASTECSTLYLSGALSKQCKQKIRSFIDENNVQQSDKH